MPFGKTSLCQQRVWSLLSSVAPKIATNNNNHQKIQINAMQRQKNDIWSLKLSL